MKRKVAKMQALYDFFEAYVTAMIYIAFCVDPLSIIEDDSISYHSESECVMSDAFLEYQQCQMECAHT